MKRGSARGIAQPGAQSLSIRELALWAPRLDEVLREMGIQVAGNEEASLAMLCEEAGIHHDDVFEALSATPKAAAELPDVNRVEIRAGRGKAGEAEPVTNLTIERGEIVALVGPTGSGKSQLLSDIETLTQGDSPSGRVVLLDGEPPADELRWSPASRPVAQISQSMNFLLDLQVQEFLDMHAACRGRGESAELADGVVEAACTLCGEPFGTETPIVSLSGGQSRALMIADAVLISQAPLVLVDEIENAGIDREKAMEFLVGQRKIAVMATHDPLLALRAQRRVVLANGAMTQLVERSDDEGEILDWLERQEQQRLALRRRLRRGERLEVP